MEKSSLYKAAENSNYRALAETLINNAANLIRDILVTHSASTLEVMHEYVKDSKREIAELKEQLATLQNREVIYGPQKPGPYIDVQKLEQMLRKSDSPEGGQ